VLLTPALPKALPLHVQSLANGLAEGLITLPDTVFILNVNDVSFCADPGFVPGQPQVEFDGVHGKDTLLPTFNPDIPACKLRGRLICHRLYTNIPTCKLHGRLL